MDVPTLMYNLKEEVTCSVCIQLYTNPKQLPCLHIFCLECLNNLARTSTRYGKIKCPICQAEVAVPKTGTMDALPSCFYVKNLLDTLAIKECNTSKVTCGNCDEKRDEASYCFHCGKFWCKECLNGHNILRENKDHRVLSLRDFQDEDFEEVLKRPAFCQKELHEKEVLKFYCKVCEVPVCQNCVIVEHSKHDVEYLEVSARAVKKSIASKLETVKESSQFYADTIQEYEEKSRILEHRSKIVKGQIQEATKSLILTLQRREEEMIAKVENEAKRISEVNMRDKGEWQDKLKKSEEFIKQAERLLERSTGAELVRSTTAIDEHFNHLESALEAPNPMSPADRWATFLMNQEISQILQDSVIGRLDKTATAVNQCSVEGLREATVGLETKFQVITRNSQGEQYYCPGDYISVSVNSAQGGKVGAEVKITDNNNGNYTVSFIPTLIGQHVATIQVNGDKIQEIQPIDIKERSYGSLRLVVEGNIDGKKLVKPWGVAVNGLDEIFTTDLDNNRIVVVNEMGECIRSFGQNLIQSPAGICIDKGNRIYVTNRLNNKILLFNPKGEYVTEVHNGETLKEPRGIAQDAQGNLIVCDTGNSCVRFLSPDGNIFKTIGKGRLQMPFDCLCHEDKILVSDHDAHVIKVYNSNGRFLYEFGRFGMGDGELNMPTGLAVDKTGHLLVCCEFHPGVQVFTLEGKFVAKFGKELRLVRPTGVSILKSGLIVVCEFGKGRLQIFE